MSDSLSSALEILVYVAMAGVVVALFLGLGSMYSGNKRHRNKSNVFMRWRVGLQALAIALLAVLVFVVKS
jgi:ABC-type dipeptide/oligopeptide/nickel transport system permease component